MEKNAQKPKNFILSLFGKTKYIIITAVILFAFSSFYCFTHGEE